MERQPHQPNGGEKKPEVNSYGTDDPEEQARIERARQQAAEQRKRDRERLERYVEAGLRPDDAEALIEFEHYVRDQRERAATQQAEQHPDDTAAEREIRHGLYLARSEGRTIDDTTAQDLAAELHGEEGSALDSLASSGAIQRDQLLQELAGYPVEGSWRVHWVDALTQYVLERGERGPVPDWADQAADVGEPGDSDAHLKASDAQAERAVSVERGPRPTPRIYVACLASYNQGILHGLWIEADQEPEDLQADVEAMLASSPMVGAEEFAIHDHQGFHGFDLGEHEELAVVSRVAQGVARHGEAFAAYLTWAGSSEEACRDFRQHYVGTFPDAEAWAREAGQEFEWERQLEQRLDPDLRPYVRIDYAAFARDMANHWHVIEGSAGVHVFGP